jgi:hypothetical protein
MFTTLVSRRAILIGGSAMITCTSLSRADGPSPKTQASAPLTLAEQLIHSTIMIRCSNAKGEPSSGTGFLFSFFRVGDQSVPAIVTNKHVISGARTGQLRFTLQKDGKPDYGSFVDIKLDNFENLWIPHDLAEVDLAIFPCGKLLGDLIKIDKNPFTVGVEKDLVLSDDSRRDLTPLEDLIVIGYPDGISDSKNNTPILRKGITATPVFLDFEGRKEFLIDAAIYPGSSGSPVYLFNIGAYPSKDGGIAIGNRVKLLGVVYAVAQHSVNGEIRIVPAPTQATPIVSSLIPNNLGVCIAASRILEFEPILMRLGVRPPTGYKIRSDEEANKAP